MQLKQPLVQKWTSTTLPRSLAIVSGPEFTHSVTLWNSGAGAVFPGARYCAGGRRQPRGRARGQAEHGDRARGEKS